MFQVAVSRHGVLACGPYLLAVFTCLFHQGLRDSSNAEMHVREEIGRSDLQMHVLIAVDKTYRP